MHSSLYQMLLFLKFIFLILPILVSVAFITLLERKILGLVGTRLGPSKVSLGGFLQPLGDALKLFNKQCNSISSSFIFFYYFSPIVFISSSLCLWWTLFFDPSVFSLKFSLLIFFILLSMSSVATILCGWSTFGKYPLIGSLRSVSQLVSYEASLYLILLFLVFFFYSFSMNYFFFQEHLSLFMIAPFCLIFWVPSFLAELNRTPFDFSEGESELVSGFFTEFGSNCFTLLFLGEYSNIIFFCLISSFLFFSPSFFFFFFFFLFFVVWIRCVVPRYRFDKLMYLCWKMFIPILSLYFMILICFSF